MTQPPSPYRWIAHMDLDAFFASCEQRDQPEYRGRPVVVGALPGHRGVVAAASYEARRYGIHSAMPIAEAYRRCPDAVYLRPDMAKYKLASRQVFGVLAGLEVVRSLNDLGYETERPIEVAVWTNEEGSRFPPAMVARSDVPVDIISAICSKTTDGCGPNIR